MDLVHRMRSQENHNKKSIKQQDILKRFLSGSRYFHTFICLYVGTNLKIDFDFASVSFLVKGIKL